MDEKFSGATGNRAGPSSQSGPARYGDVRVSIREGANALTTKWTGAPFYSTDADGESTKFLVFTSVIDGLLVQWYIATRPLAVPDASPGSSETDGAGVVLEVESISGA